MSIEIIESEISKLKKEIALARQEKAECEGSLKTLMNVLKTKFDIDSLEGAEKKLKKWEVEVLKLEKELEESFQNLKAEYQW